MSSSKPIYLDYASTHPRIALVQSARTEFENTSYANIWRGNYDLSESALIAYLQSKNTVASYIGCEPVEILYTYSTTYAMNILSLALEHNHVVQSWDTILLSVSEHHANIVPWQMLAERVWAQIQFVWLDSDYRIDLEDLRSKLDDTVKVVSLQYASNVTGAVHPLEKVRKIIGHDRLFFVDAAQMVAHGPLSMETLLCDALVFSWHKIGADTGIWVLALRKQWQKSWKSPLSGGGAIQNVSQYGYQQSGIPDRWEPGTPHITGAITVWRAIEILRDTTDCSHYLTCRAAIDTGFQKIGKSIQLYHSYHPQALWIWSFFIPWKHVTDVADVFSDQGIYVRAGHHCCEPLHAFFGTSTVRISIGYDTTLAEVESFFRVLHFIIDS